MLEDWDLIVPSFQMQYNIRLSRELNTMPWFEFCQLLSGINGDTPLGRIVSIRAEENPERIKAFNPDERRIYNEWRRRRAAAVSQTELNAALESFKAAFISMSGNNKKEG